MLLLHGFGDTPQTLRYLALRAHAAGYSVRAPLYHGHGTTVAEFLSSSADAWIESARDGLASLRERCESVSIVGLSMGAAIGAILAAEHRKLAALVLIAPYFEVPLWIRAALPVRWLWSPIVGTIEASHSMSIKNEEERAKSLAYGVVNAGAMAQLERVARRGREALSDVVAPTLVIQSRDDPRVKSSVAELVMKKLGAREKRVVWENEGGHVLTVDYGREKVFAETLAWVARWSGQPR